MFISKFLWFARKFQLINFDHDERLDFKQRLNCIFMWSCTFRYLFAAITTNTTIWSLIGDPFYYTNDRFLFNLVLFGISLLASLQFTTIIIGEFNIN